MVGMIKGGSERYTYITLVDATREMISRPPPYGSRPRPCRRRAPSRPTSKAWRSVEFHNQLMDPQKSLKIASNLLLVVVVVDGEAELDHAVDARRVRVWVV